MSNLNHKSRGHEGNFKSYVIGYVLSLILTLIPYFLVTNRNITGTPLLITIVVFAMIQMVVQLIFFLHLGGEPKPRWNLFFFVATVGLAAVVVGGSVFIMNDLHYNMSPTEKVAKIANDEGIYQIGGQKTGACKEYLVNHRVTIKDGKVNPVYITASQCDTLTFINEDDYVHEITFGEHPDHGVYAGELELPVKAGKSKTITLSETGDFEFHDHLQPETAGYFTVNK